MIRGLLVVGFLLGGEVLCSIHAPSGIEHQHSARIDALERQWQGIVRPPPRTSSTYVHWGMATCPNVPATTMVYSGQAAGGRYDDPGSGEYICLPNDPEYDEYSTSKDEWRSRMYGAEYEIPDRSLGKAFHEHDVPCSLCLAREKTTVMIPGRTSCYRGWTIEYQGYLMGRPIDGKAQDMSAWIKNAETLPGTSANLNGALFYFVEGRCGALQCPPYIDGAELPCVVCSTTD